MKSKIILICVFGMLFVACKKEKTLNDFMIGNWQTEYMKIEMPTVNKTDSTSVMEEDFSTPNSARAQSTYKKDGTFTAWFKEFNGNIVGEGDLAIQTQKAMDNLKIAMKAAGGTLSDIVMLRIYKVNYQQADGAIISEALKNNFGSENPPASTWLNVQGLANEDFMIEIEAQAVI